MGYVLAFLVGVVLERALFSRGRTVRAAARDPGCGLRPAPPPAPPAKKYAPNTFDAGHFAAHHYWLTGERQYSLGDPN